MSAGESSASAFEPIVASKAGPRSWVMLILLLLAAVMVTRASAFGNPLYSADDPLYLQFGLGIDHGLVPYLDIWDRKPLGLFLVYAAIGFLPFDPVYAYQMVGGLFVLATAVIVYRIARLYSGDRGAVAAALAFIILLPAFKGAAGQAQVFYEPLIALSAWLVIRPAAGRRLTNSLWAILLCGIAFTLKQTVIVESAFLGIWLVVVSWREHGTLRAGKLAGVLALVFAVPTLLTFVVMAGYGELGLYIQSSFLSVFHKGSETSSVGLSRVVACFILLAPLVGFAAGGYYTRRKQHGEASTREKFIFLWALSALGGVILIPRFYAYYPIPLLLPLSIAASSFFERPGTGRLFLVALAAVMLMQGDVLRFADTKVTRAQLAVVVTDIRREAHGGCLFVADGPGWLYSASGIGCRTRYRFPDHLSLVTEAGAIGQDQGDAVRAILAQHPAVIVLRAGDDVRNPHIWPLFSKALASYHVVRRDPLTVEYMPQTMLLWVRNA